MKRALFVDDEPKVLEGLKRMLYPLRNEWQTVFACNGRDALQLLSESDYDVLVTDIRMPGMSGIELLQEVVEQFPQVVRLVLSGTADRALALRSVALAHQYLIKPCDPAMLRATLEQAFLLLETAC
jgi:YesN/AraC family two-component response regulator